LRQPSAPLFGLSSTPDSDLWAERWRTWLGQRNRPDFAAGGLRRPEPYRPLLHPPRSITYLKPPAWGSTRVWVWLQLLGGRGHWKLRVWSRLGDLGAVCGPKNDKLAGFGLGGPGTRRKRNSGPGQAFREPVERGAQPPHRPNRPAGGGWAAGDKSCGPGV